MTHLKALREQQGLSQRKLATLSGVHHVSLAKIELGSIDPRLSTLRRLANALNVSMSELVGDEVQPQLSNKRRTSHGTDQTKRRVVRRVPRH